MCAAIYRTNPDSAGDSQFEPGGLRHLVVGNRGRLLDARRTPLTITALTPASGAFEVEIGAFEDAGARWELPLGEVARLQFQHGSRSASQQAMAELTAAAAKFDRELMVEPDPATREKTLRRVAAQREALRGRLTAGVSQADVVRAIASREGDERLFALLDATMGDLGLADLEERFSSTFVSNPGSGEFVKAHAIVLAELGLARYRGQIVRNPDVFAPEVSRSRRAEHLVTRLAFTQALWSALGYETVVLYRGMASDGPLSDRSAASFLSATFSREVATAHFEGGPTTKSAALWRNAIPVERLVMTFLETRAMSRRFREAEAVLISDPSAHPF